MKQIVIFFLMIISLVVAEDNYLNIDAKSFESNTNKNMIYFKGDVKMTKNSDILQCQKLVIYTKKTKKNAQQPIKYIASGDVTFTIILKNKTLKGKGDEVVYLPNKQKYTIKGDAFLEDTTTDKKLYASKIYIDEKTGLIKIDGEKNKPVKFRLKLGN